MKHLDNLSSKPLGLNLRAWGWRTLWASSFGLSGGREIVPRSNRFTGVSRTTSRSEIVIISSIVILGAILTGIASQKLLFMDEKVIFRNVTNFFKNHTLIPTHFNYPTLFSYLAAIPIALNVLFLWFIGIVPGVHDIGALFAVDPLKVLMPARIMSIGFGLLNIILVYIIGKRFYDAVTGLVAATCLALSSIYIRYSSFALPDVTMTFFATGTLLYAFKAMHTKSTRDLFFGGIFLGLAVSTKYNAGMALIPLLFSYIIILKDEDKTLLTLRNFADSRLILTGFLALLAFIIASPGWIINPKPFIKAILYEMNHMRIGHLGAFGPSYLHHLVLFWRADSTIAILFGAGLIFAAVRRRREDLLLIVFILSSYVIIGRWQTKQLHYLLFIYPALALLGGNLISQIRKILKRRTHWMNVSTSLAILVVFGWPLYSLVMTIPRQLKVDNRTIAEQWIQQNIPAGSSVAVDWAYIPKLYTSDEVSNYLTGMHKIVYKKYLDETRTFKLISVHDYLYDTQALQKSSAQYFVTSSWCYGRFFYTPSPPFGSPLYEKFQKRKQFYEYLFQGEVLTSWSLTKEFKLGFGPVVRIYKRIIRSS